MIAQCCTLVCPGSLVGRATVCACRQEQSTGRCHCTIVGSRAQCAPQRHVSERHGWPAGGQLLSDVRVCGGPAARSRLRCPGRGAGASRAASCVAPATRGTAGCPRARGVARGCCPTTGCGMKTLAYVTTPRDGTAGACRLVGTTGYRHTGTHGLPRVQRTQ